MCASTHCLQTGHNISMSYCTKAFGTPYIQRLACGYSKQSQRAIDELQRTVVEVESKYKTELGRVRKKYDQQFTDYESQIDIMSRSNGELSRANKALAARVKVSALLILLT